jgi:hypothetical protein
MRKCNFALRLQPSLLTEARKVAEAEGVALNQLINVAVAEKLSALRTEDYFTTRAARSRYGWFASGWLWAKIALVLALSAVHGLFARWVKGFAADSNPHSQRFYRFINEVPTVLMIAIVILVVADVPKALKILKRAGLGKAPMKGDELLPTKRRKAQTGPLPLPIGLKNIEMYIPQHGMNAFDPRYVRQAGNERTRGH